MRDTQKQQGPVPAPIDNDAPLAEQNQFNATARPALKSQIVLSLKVLLIGGAVMLALWLIDYAVIG
jgi:hypothetical protein